MMLELAENNGYGGLPESALAQAPANRESPYLFVPGGMIPGMPQDSFVNEKEFDDLPEIEWQTIMSMLEPYQENQMGVWPFSTKKGRARRKIRKEERQARKMEKITARGEIAIQKRTAGGGILDTVSSIFGGAQAMAPAVMAPPPPPPKKKTWFQKNWMLVAGIGAAGIVVVMMTRRPRPRAVRAG